MHVKKKVTKLFTRRSIESRKDRAQTRGPSEDHSAGVQQFASHPVEKQKTHGVGAHLHGAGDGKVYVDVAAKIANVKAQTVVYHVADHPEVKWCQIYHVVSDIHVVSIMSRGIKYQNHQRNACYTFRNNYII